MSSLALIGKVQRLRRLRAVLNPPPPPEAPRTEVAEGSRALTLDDLVERYKGDFEGFCGLLDIIPKQGERRRLTPFRNTQRIANAARTGRDVYLKPRRVGITTLECARDIWFFLMRPSAYVVVAVQSVTDHMPLKSISKILRVMFESLARAGIAIPWRTFSANRWEIEGRDSELTIIEAGASEAAAEKKGRAGLIHRLHCSETAFWIYAQETLNALLECVPDPNPEDPFATEIVFESTPNGAAGYFFEQYQQAKKKISAYTAHFLRWFDNTDDNLTPLDPGEVIEPRDERERRWIADGLRPEQIKWYRAKLVDKRRQDLVDQEYPSDEDSCWLIAGNGFFDQIVTNLLILRVTPAAKVTPVRTNGAYGEVRSWFGPESGRVYIVSADPSEGTGGDPAAAHVYERVTGRHMATLDGQIPPWEFARWLAKVGRAYGWALIAVERNNHGHTVLRCLAEEQKYPRIFVDRDDRPGWLTHEVTRVPALDTLEEAHRTGHWQTRDRVVLGEFRTFVRNPKTGKAEASRGAHDDHVMTAAIGWDVLCRREQHRDATNLPSF